MMQVYGILCLVVYYCGIFGSQDGVRRDAVSLPAPQAHYSERLHETTGERITKPTMLVLHYTEESLGKTLCIFVGGGAAPVASHYTISEDGCVFQHVAESMAARHAGISYWRGFDEINIHSIGIEHVNKGYAKACDTVSNNEANTTVTIPGDDRAWYPFSEEQIRASIVLCKKIIEEYGIDPRNVVGHSDIAPRRKVDPGPLFPWKRFAHAGIGTWPLPQASSLPCLQEACQRGEYASWVIDHLQRWGYKSPDATASTEDLIRSFQMHFRQANIDGIADEETARVLSDLLQTYDVAKNGVCPCMVRT